LGRAAPDDRDLRIGAGLRALRDEIEGFGRQLQSVLQGPIQEVVRESLSALKKQQTQIAVIGQIKAGKSSFVNALTKMPGLLPTDVNPWTAVVTRLHFGSPGAPQKGALFTFFERDEWQRLAGGGGRFKALIERLVPGYDESAVRSQLDEMRRRAELRLGPFYHNLFGQTRWFADISPEIIERYVCLGLPLDEPSYEQAPGKFADIVKTADLFFGNGPFAFPATVIDTPGTNDPLLVRDDVTLSAIEEADVFVVVLTAQQPLTAADLALLRILHGLRKERVIIFINRLDDISDPASAHGAILTGVGELLRREFPSAHIPIVAGSALWADTALSIGRTDPGMIWSAGLIGYARSTGIMKPGEPPHISGAQALPPERISQILFACSGLPEIMAHISKLMLKGMSGQALGELGSTLIAAAESSVASARNELLGASTLSTLSTMDGGNISNARLGVVEDMERLRRLELEANRYLQGMDKEVQRQALESLRPLREMLRREISAFAREQAANLRASLLHGQSGRVWRCDVVTLRNRIEEKVLQAFWAAGRRFVETQRQIGGGLRRLLREAAPDIGIELQPASLLSFNLTPPLTALSRPLTFDLEEKWWQAWWRREAAVDEKARRMEEMILAEFFPVADELAIAAQNELRSHISSALQPFLIRCESVANAIRERQQRLLTERSGDSLKAWEMEERTKQVFARLKESERLSIALGTSLKRHGMLADAR
jgi:signal recognition particle receptor subunit beta